MKQLKRLSVAVFFLLGIIISLSGCYESHYHRTYSHHSRGWYDHRHRAYPSGVNFEVDVYSRHHRHH